MYEISVRQSAKKDLKHLDRQVREIIVNEIFPALSLDPYQGQRLHGKKMPYWKYAFSFRGIEYRIAYDIYQQQLVIIIILVGSRENFYKRLKQRIK